MRALHVFCVVLLATGWQGCATSAASAVPFWEDAQGECSEPHEDVCLAPLCEEDTCAFFRCEHMLDELTLARFPPARPPAASAAPGGGPRRNWGSGLKTPGGHEPVFVIPWHGSPRPTPPRFQLPPGRFEKHHIFPQAEDLALWFRSRGLNIHDYTLPLPRDVHQRIHRGGDRGGAWNKAWREYQRQNPFPSKEEIFKHAGELIYRFQLLGGPVKPYYTHLE
ncbi:TIGR02269 family lipoprotein [Myxococcus sp. CA056]|uniref:SitA6 family polymorphic toxin lipoprotein n=1 Tax=unclassified Myxococcus TaxID=2648731 RepID=UPI00157B6D0A|nr:MULTISPECIES: TIGR02269 family lipoprotein [unclassified Myxococcus]NTX16610.1 TIGR02269 family lipoprotein [Myxococcus sp. CA056]NTX39475.1 TIGR02269 family lipoprotein [Myxococcus sp. CA033]NTX57351.1 TIGR02269 family lipoprotein [Myxococcus sp. CA039A]